MSSDAWQQEKAFLDYMYESLHHNNNGNAIETSNVVTRGVVSTPDGGDPSARGGLDHLDNLCKLMEQLGELRDQNSRLQKRVQYLEDMKTLQQMQQELDIFVSTDSIAEAAAEAKHEAKYQHHSIDSLDVDQTAVVPVLTGVVTSPSPAKTPDKIVKNKTPNRFKKPLLLKYRERSKSVGFDEPGNTEAGTEPVYTPTASMPPPLPSATSSTSGAHLNPPVTLLTSDSDEHGSVVVLRPKTKVSKWTRVKEAFRWEKAHVDPPKVAPIPSPSSASANKTIKDEVCKSSLPDENTVGSSSGSSQPSSPMFQLGRVSSNSSSSSSLSECPLESEILRSFADAQQLPLFKLRNRNSSPELKIPARLAISQPEQQQQQPHQSHGTVLEPNGSPTTRSERKTVHQQPQTPRQGHKRRLHRQSTVSCDGNFAVSCPTIEQNADGDSLTADYQQLDLKSPVWKRKISRETVPEEIYAEDVDDSAEAGFVANRRSQLRPVNEWTTKWHADFKNPLTGAECSRNALSVPSSPNRHQSFTFDEFPESEKATGTSENASPQSRDTSPAVSVRGPESPSKAAESTAESPKLSIISTLANPGHLLTSISPEFRKKVEAWERMKSGGMGSSTTSDIVPASPSIPSPSAAATSDKLPPAFKKKLAEWEIRKAVAGKSDQNVEELQKILPQDFNRKLQEWERMKAAGKPSSPALERQGSASNKNRNKLGGSKTSGKSREEKHVKMKSEVIQREKQKEKELQWLEKELQKIEREKQRLEREREKYIERETRLEKIREAMRQPQSHREICIRTSTGEFRFQGLSRKFTKKLWQWEEQRGIRPEASTIALLDRAYRPGQIPADYGSRPPSKALGRSKSESSVADLVSASVHSQPSSLSLNDADTSAVASAADFDRRLVAAADMEDAEATAEAKGALLVEVEDVMDESVAVVDLPDVNVRAPIYAPTEVRQTIEPQPVRHQTSQEGQEVHHIVKEPVQRNDSVRTHDSFQLLEENISILDRLRAKGEIVKYLELQMNTIDGDMAGVASTQTEEMDRLKEEEATANNNAVTMERLKQRIVFLENRGRRLKVEKDQLKSVYQKHCSQQVTLVQDLVEKMQQLQGIGAADVATSIECEETHRLQTLTRELLEQVQQLESSIRQPQKENLSPERLDCGSNEDVSVVVPEQLSLKANQLKEEFRRLRQESDTSEAPEAAEALPEMSSADRKKIFVETRRLLFAPVDYYEPPKIHVIQVEPPPPPPLDGEQSIAPWRRHRSTQDLTPWRKHSVPHQEAEELDSRPPVAPSVRPTAPNIRRMIDKYHERISGRSERNLPSLNLQHRYSSGSGFTSPSPTVTESQTPEPIAGLDDSDTDTPTQPSMNQLSKSQSAGAVGRLCGGRSMNVLPTKASPVSLGVPRSKSGHHISSVPSTPTATLSTPEASNSCRQICSRNPSFFRKSPLDPSIDELLQQYKTKTTPVPSVAVQEPPKSPGNHERAVRLRQAREAFLSVGPGAFHSPSVSPTTPTTPSFPISDDEHPDPQCGSPQQLSQNSLPELLPEAQPESPKPPQEPQQEQKLELQLEHRQQRVEISVEVPTIATQMRAEPVQHRNPLRVVQMLCRQSLLVDLRSAAENRPPENGAQSCPSSPSLNHDGSSHFTSPLSRPSWLKQPRIFFSKPKSP